MDLDKFLATSLETAEQRADASDKDEKILLILNPEAGQATSLTSLGDYLQILGTKGNIVEVYFTQAEGDATRIVEEIGANYDLVIAAGGDGTLNELVSGAVGAELTKDLGYLPSGTTCDFAKSIGIPLDLEHAAYLARYGDVREFDVGLFSYADTHKYFTYIASFGAFTEVAYETDNDAKSTYGFFAYVVKGLQSLRNIQRFTLNYEIDGKKGSGEFLFGAILNSRQAANGILTIDAEKMSYDDAKFEVLLVRAPDGVIEARTILNGIANNDFSNEAFLFTKANSINIEFDAEVPWTLDGEYGGTSSEASIDVLSKAWRLRY